MGDRITQDGTFSLSYLKGYGTKECNHNYKVHPPICVTASVFTHLLSFSLTSLHFSIFHKQPTCDLGAASKPIWEDTNSETCVNGEKVDGDLKLLPLGGGVREEIG